MKISTLLKIGFIILNCLTINSWATNIKHVQDVSKYPISSDLISVSRGGTLPDKKAITDGIGTVLVGSFNLYNNSNLENLSGLRNITSLGEYIYVDNHTITTKIPTSSWLCNINQQSKFQGLSQTNACESVTN